MASEGTSGNIWRHTGLSLLKEEGITGIVQVEARDTVRHPIVHGTVSITNNHLAHNVNNAETEKPYIKRSKKISTANHHGCETGGWSLSSDKVYCFKTNQNKSLNILQ